MSQPEIVEFLKEHKPQWFTIKKISVIIININRGTICENMKRLRRNKLVNSRCTDDKRITYEYSYKE